MAQEPYGAGRDADAGRATAEIGGIEGLGWVPNFRIENGTDSFVVPFATCRPVNIVFHGTRRFDYGHYGIHLGQEDHLTFLGPSSQAISAYFIDCRLGSATAHKKVVIDFTPTSERMLVIPAGIAHAFDGLENVHTLNCYRLLLPHPERWATGDIDWRLESDVINVPMEVTPEDVALYRPNECNASDRFYELIAENQRQTLPSLQHEYPSTREVALRDGTTVQIKLHKRSQRQEAMPAWSPIEDIPGLGWEAHLVLYSGETSGFVPLLDTSALYVVDHGEHNCYTHDAFGIHLGQQDRLTFLGPADHTATATFVDCRAGSPTLHRTVSQRFTPDARRCLVIPNGVAHRFEHLERVYTVNRPFSFLSDTVAYQPGTDVIDWPIEWDGFPVLEVNTIPASRAFYEEQARAQRELTKAPPMHATPLVLMAKDSEGRPVRVVLRKRLRNGDSERSAATSLNGGRLI